MDQIFILIWLIPAVAVLFNIVRAHVKGEVFSVWFTPQTYVKKKDRFGFYRVLLLNYLLFIIFAWSAMNMAGLI